MVSIVSILWHFMTPSKYWERCFRACVTVMSRLLYVFSAAKFYTNIIVEIEKKKKQFNNLIFGILSLQKLK